MRVVKDEAAIAVLQNMYTFLILFLSFAKVYNVAHTYLYFVRLVSALT